MSGRFPGLGFDPAPGDPDAARLCSRVHGRTAAELDALAVEVSRLGEVSSAWRGAAASAFSATLSPLPGQLREAAEAFAASAARLSAWADELDDLQARARVLERAAGEALDRIRAGYAAAARAPAGTPAGTSAGIVFAPVSHVVDTADAEDELRRVTWQAEELRAAWRAAGRQAGAAIGAAAAAAPATPRGVGEVVWDHRNRISGLVDVCTVASVPALAVPVVGLGLGAVGTAGAVALNVYADGSAADVGVGAAGLGLAVGSFQAGRVLRGTPLAAVATRVTTHGLRAAEAAFVSAAAALTVRKHVVDPPPPPRGRAGHGSATQRLLVAPVVGTPSRRRR